MIMNTPDGKTDTGRFEPSAAVESGFFDLLLPAAKVLTFDLRSDERIDIKLFLG